MMRELDPECKPKSKSEPKIESNFKAELEELKKSVSELIEKGKTNPEYAKEIMRFFYSRIEDFANFDHFREVRAGKPEAIFAPGKSKEDLLKIIESVLRNSDGVLITKASEEQITAIKEKFDKVFVNDKSRTIIVGEKRKFSGKVAVVSAGTSDIPIAEEAVTTAEFLGLEVIKFYDVGVAGIHRLIHPIKEIVESDVDSIIVVAGMEGALPSVIAGLVDVPIIAVPTSVGYGTNLSGITTLFAMLQSCSSGVAVVNIDNGFGAGVFAYMISRIRRRGFK